MKKKILRVTTIPTSLKILLRGQLKFINENENFEIIGVSSPGIELKDVEMNEGITCYSIPMTRKINPFSDILAIWKLYILIRKVKPYIVHTHTPKAGLIGMLAAFMARVPYRFHTVAGLPLMEKSGLIRYLLLRIEKLTYLLSTLVLPNSYGLRDFMLGNRLISDKKLKVIGFGSSNGINLDHYCWSPLIDSSSKSLRESLYINDSDIVFLFIGRIVSHKGIDELLSAFEKISNEYLNVKLILVGDFERDLDPISKKSLKLINRENVKHVGYQADVRPFLQMSDVFVFPSYREGFPNAVLQACAFNLPCIVTDIIGCNEIIDQEKEGLIIPSKDCDAIYLAMKKFIINPALINLYGANSRSKISQKYDQKFVWNEVLSLYESTL